MAENNGTEYNEGGEERIVNITDKYIIENNLQLAGIEEALVRKLASWSECASCAYTVPYVSITYKEIMDEVNRIVGVSLSPEPFVVALYKRIKYGPLCTGASHADVTAFAKLTTDYPCGHLALACIRALLVELDSKYRAKAEHRL